MRRVQVVITAVCLASVVVGGVREAHALESSAFGIKAGFNIASIALVPEDDFITSKSGVLGGASFGFPIAENVVLQPAALLSIKGAGERGDSDSLTIHYLEIPVLAVLRPLGLRNINNDVSSHQSEKNRAFSVMVGTSF